MAPSVLYHCQCNLGVIDHARADQAQHGDSSQASSSSLPLLPTQYASARYSFHPLANLYYCLECSQIRCRLCSQSEIVAHYCPACLFDVPSATVKAERNRCARNCFLCPVEGCGHLLSVTATDPKDYGRMEAPEASIGVPPWLLFCQACSWDSKRAFRGGPGYVFEKSTGINAQVEAQRGPLPGQVEMDKLRSHYDFHLRKHSSTVGGVTSVAGRVSSSLSKSKLLRDLPGLENSKYLAGSRRGAALGLDKASAAATRSEDLPPYTSDLSSASLDVLGKRESERQRFTRDLGPNQINMASGAEGRWSDGWDQGPKSSHLVPLRVPLQTSSTLRCPGCRHILMKPDLKRGGHRFKITLHASLHLPEVRVYYKGIRNRTGPRQSSALRETDLSGRSRHQSIFLPASDGGSGARASAVRDEQMTMGGEERLQRGNVYEYELAFVNPDLNAIAVHISVVQPALEAIGKQEGLSGNPNEQDVDISKPAWTVQPSTTRFTVKASDDLDVIDADLFGDLGMADEDEDIEEEGSGVRNAEGKGRRRGIEVGVVKKERNQTVIALRLDISGSETQELQQDCDVEFALKVTFTCRQDPSDAALSSREAVVGSSTDSAHGQATRTRSFWTCVRLGKIITGHPTPTTQATNSSGPVFAGDETQRQRIARSGGPTDDGDGDEDEEDRERSARLRKRRSELNLGSS